MFSAPPTLAGALTGGGSFQFHFGIDISAPDHTAVYPVASGNVTRLEDHWLEISCGGGRSFQYWHIDIAVRLGDHVIAEKTVLGRIHRNAKHLHFSELQGNVFVNPLQAGHLAPYTDRVAPRIASISVRTSNCGARVSQPGARLRRLRRRGVRLVRTFPCRASGVICPVAPALITWQIRSLNPKIVVPRTVTVDFRSTMPDSRNFWRVYARGSYQNMSVFGKHYSYRQPGHYLYRLTPTSFNTARLKDSVYDLVVTATDVRGNATTSSLRFTVDNRAGQESS